MLTFRACGHLARGVVGAGLAVWLTACAVPATPPATTSPESSLTSVSAPPEWRPGDRWVYGWRSGAESGTKTVEILEIQEINNVPFYLVRVGDLEHFYTRDLHWAGSMREQRVEARMVPPQPWFVWPLEAGRRWTHRGTFEEPRGKKQHNDVFAVVGAETVEVPAGRFSALKVVREADRRESDEYWYAPEVRFYVKWIGRRGDVQFEEQLREYRAAPRLIPGPRPSTPPSTTK